MLADRALRRGQVRLAGELYRQLLDRAPHDRHLQNRTGDVLLLSQEHQAAMRLFLAAALAWERDCFPRHALAVYAKILRHRPDHHGALAARRRLLAQLELPSAGR